MLTRQHALDHVQAYSVPLPYKYMAPESIRQGIFSHKVNSLCVNSPCLNSPCVNSPCVNSPTLLCSQSDAWMAGVLMWEIFCEEMPFEGLNNTQAGRYVSRGNSTVNYLIILRLILRLILRVILRLILRLILHC